MSDTITRVRDLAQERTALNLRLTELIIERLGLDTKVEYVSYNQPLFGRGLEMDSLDTLELVVAVGNEFNVQITDDDVAAFGSINALADFIVAQRQS